MRKVLALVLLSMVVGCSRPPQPQVAEPPAAGPVNQTDPAKVYDPPPQPPATAEPIEAHLPVPAPLPDGLRRVELAAGQAVDSPGLYFMDVATGKLDGWLTPQAGDYRPAYSLWSSDDERWIQAITAEGDIAYVIRRSDGAAFRYDPRRLDLSFGPGVLLARPNQWRQGDGSRCALLDEQVKLRSTFSLTDGCLRDNAAVFSPDGSVLAVLSRHGEHTVSLVTVATGAVSGLGHLTIPGSRLLQSVGLKSAPAPGEFIVQRELSSNVDPNQGFATEIRRYSWQGQLRSEQTIPGHQVTLSPNGKLVAWSQSIPHLGGAAVLQEWGTDKPLFRVAGGVGPNWVAGGGELLVHTTRGYQFVARDGIMRPAPLTDERSTFQPFAGLAPSPDNPDLFLTGTRVVNRAGRTVQAVTFVETKGLRAYEVRWGPTAGSIRFVVWPFGGKGYEPDLWFWIAPKVQRPPYPDEFPLQVEDPKGECLNLREEADPKGRLIRCLPTGTRLKLATTENISQLMLWQAEHVWARVKTDKGEVGWVAVSTRSLAYAD